MVMMLMVFCFLHNLIEQGLVFVVMAVMMLLVWMLAFLYNLVEQRLMLVMMMLVNMFFMDHFSL